MRWKPTRLTGCALGFGLGAAWILLATALATKGFTELDDPPELRHIYAAFVIPLTLAVFGYLLGALSEEARELTRRAQDRALELENVLEHVGEAIVVLDAAGLVCHVTQSYASLAGIGAEEALGRPFVNFAGFLALTRPDGSVPPVCDLPVMRALRGEEVVNEYLESQRDGARVELMVNARPVLDPATGKVIMAVCSARNVTEMRQLDRLKDEFIATASHELRTPMTLIRALAQLSLIDLSAQQPEAAAATETPGAETAVNLQSIIEQTDRTAHLLNQMLDTSRIDTGRLVLRQKQVMLPALLRRELERWQITFPSHQVSLDLEEVKGPGQPVLADEERLLEVLDNLVSNAVKYSPAGSDVIVGVQEGRRGVEVWVKDQGMGVPAEDREAIFSKFYRSANAVNSDRSGLGLGLYIARRLVELHGGRIWLDPRRSQGSTFRFSLPFAPAPSPTRH